MTNRNKQINHTLNYVKALACFCVIMLHCGFPGIVGKLLYGSCRFAVPFFFMVSGYYVYGDYSNKNDYNRLNRKVKHIGLLLLGTEITYFIWHILYAFISGGISAVGIWFSESFTLQSLLRLIVFQTTPIGDVSWFLVALLLCYIFTYFLARRRIWKQAAYLILPLLLVNAIIGELLPFFGIATQWYWCSNVWVLGFPFYALGYWVKMNETALIKKVTAKKTIIVIVISVVIVLVERVCTSASQFFIGNILCVLAIFLFAVKYPAMAKGNKIIEIIGDKLSFYVYILHPIARDIYSLIFEGLGMESNMLVMWIKPVIVFVVCLGVAYLVVLSKNMIHKKLSHEKIC